MVPVLVLVAKQCAAALSSVAVFLLVSRLIGVDFFQSEAQMVLVLALTIFALVGAVTGVRVRPWWLYLVASVGAAWLTLIGTFWLSDAIVPGTTTKLGPGGIVFLLPMMVFVFAYPLSGVAQWLVGPTKKS
jgi:hypothetical protein